MFENFLFNKQHINISIWKDTQYSEEKFLMYSKNYKNEVSDMAMSSLPMMFYNGEKN